MSNLVYTNVDGNARKYYLPKGITKNYVIINGKNFEQAIDSSIKRHKKYRKLKTGKNEDYTIGLDYEYIKNHYRLVAVDLSKQEELDAGPKAIQQIECVGQLKINKHTIK